MPYCGSNPISDLWCEKALTLMSGSFRTAVRDGDDATARTEVAMAATFAGLGFGNAGVHIPHANAYPIAGQVRDFLPDGYEADHAMVPHGMAVSLTAPEAFRWTFDAAPQRHVRAARLLEPQAPESDGPDLLPAVLSRVMRDVGIPAGLAAVGFDEGDVDALTEGALKQERLLTTAPKAPRAEDLAAIMTASLHLW